MLKQNKQLLILLLLLFSTYTWTNSCPSFYGGDLLQSGKNSFIRSGSNPQYTFDAPISFNVPTTGYELASTVSSIGDYNPSNGGFSYQLTGSRRQSDNFAQFTLIVNNGGWSSMQVSWFASARNDFAVGNVQYPINQWVRGNSANTYEISQVVNKNLGDYEYKIAVFISGFSTTDSQFRISINKKQFDKVNKKILVGFYCGANPQPTSITVSFIIYPDSHPLFQVSYETSPQGDSGAYQLTGPVNFGANIQYNEFRIANRYLACNGNQCAGQTCILREKCSELNGNPYEGQCYFCAPGIVFQFGNCLRKCGANQLYLNRVCICNQGFVRRGNDCVPKDQPPTCRGNEILYNGQCRACPPGATASQNTCNCQQGFTYDLQSNRCNQNVVQCPQGRTWNGNFCKCNDNTYEYNGQCLFCPQGSQINNQQNGCNCANGSFDIVNNRCVVINQCPQGLRWNGNSCVCLNSNQILVSGGCINCPNQARPNVNTCICPAGFSYDANLNRCGSICGQGYVWNGNGCVCPANFIAYNGACRQCPTGSRANSAQTTCQCDNGFIYDVSQNRCNNPCGANEQIGANGQCVCIRDYYNYNGKCRKCPTGSTPNVQLTSCICNRQDQTFDIVANRCTTTQCPVNQVWSNGRCVCATNFINYNGNCRQCPLSSTASTDQKTCVCQIGFTFDIFNNKCLSNCGASQVWKNGQCVCIDGYAWYNRQCRQCPASSQPAADQQTCKCTKANAIYYSNTNLCIECGKNSQPNPSRTGCDCLSGFFLQDGQCIAPNCQFNQDWVDGQCKCKFGWTQVGPTCVEACGVNQYYDGKVCLCKEGHARINGVCRLCPAGSLPNAAKNLCKCTDPKQYISNGQLVCVQVPANSNPSQDGQDFNCLPGYTKQGSQCNSNCPSPAFPDSNGNCICSGGNIWNGNSCVPPISCPAGSSFNSATSSCKCNNPNQNLIDNVCKSCGENSIWSNGKCVCVTGFFSIGGVCRTCDPRSKYDGVDCVCQLGYFGNRDLCTPCDKSCSKCSGKFANQCQACSDIALVLENGYCVKNSPCDFGFFLDSGSCTKCTDNCIDCKNVFQCSTCSIGFQTLKQDVGGQTVVSCDEICGDGIKFQHQCDDGNLKNGDGCSSTCTTQPQYFCTGGSSNQPSICKKFIPDTVQLSSKGAVNLGSSVILSVGTKFLPSCITQNQCATCFKAIKVNVVNATVPILVTINYVPFSQYQFYVKFDFQGLIVTSIFKVVIKLNDQFKGCISQEDFNEQLELTIDPAFLAKIEQTGQLSAADIVADPSGTGVPAQGLRYLGS